MSDPPIPKVVSRWQIGAGVLFAALVALACCLPLLTMDSTWYQSHEGDR